MPNPIALPDLSGRIAIVTGANSGLGRITARELARAGAHVILAVRTPAKGDQAAAQMSGSTDVRRLDLADLASVHEFADSITDPVDLLINNAGVMALPETRTTGGFEMQIATNHLGHFALTNLLLDRIKARVVTVSSVWHRRGRIRLDDLNFQQPGSYDRWQAYSQSKLANLLFTSELQRRLTLAGSNVIATAAHPGYAVTHLQSHSGSLLNAAFMAIGNRFVAQSDEAGAQPILLAATAEVPGDSYFGPSKLGELRGTPKLVDRSTRAKDADLARRLWELSEQVTSVRCPLGVAA
jgi:NAD(P)-dependent dehydrogenase (short-subunit alcohol dehydrogenase family)